MLTRLDSEQPAKKKKAKGLPVNEQLALEALRNVVIDTRNKVVSASLWHEEHRQKCPDLAWQRAGEARHALIEAVLVGADKNKVWFIYESIELTMDIRFRSERPSDHFGMSVRSGFL